MGQTMAASLHITPSRATSSNGLNLDGAKWYFYQTGTTTPQSVYTTAALDTTHANPVVADAAGKFANIYFDSSLEYRGVLKTSDDATTIYDIDPINTDALSRIAQSDGASLVGFIQSGTGAVATTAQAKLREAPVSPEDFGGSTGADILEAATASKEVKLSRGATYSLSSTVNLSALNGRVIYLNGATITGASGFTGTHLLAISGDTQIIGPGTINGANVAAPSAAYASSTYAGVGIFITGTGNFGRIDGVRFTNFQSGPILHDSTTTRDGFVVRNCSFDDVQKYTGHETNGVVHLHGVDYSLMENNVLETYNFKGYYVANSAFAQIVRCHSSGGSSSHASHYISGGNDCEILDCSHTGSGFGIKCFQTSRPTIRNFTCPSAYSAVYVQGCLGFTIDGVDATSPTHGVIYVEGVASYPTSGIVRGVRAKRAAAGTTSNHVGVYIAGAGTGTVSNVKVTNCYFENMLWGIYAVNTGIAQTEIEIVGNEFKNTGQYGFIGYIGSGKISDNLIEMDGAGVEAAVFVNRDGVTTTGNLEIARNEFKGCTADVIQIGEGGRLAYREIIIKDNYGFGGTNFLDYQGNANSADTVNYLEVSGNSFTGLTTGCTFTFNTTTSTSAKIVGNTFMNGSYALVGDTYANLTNVTFVEFREQRGTVTLSGGTANVTFALAEPNTSFRIQLGGNASETFYWSAKATSGFTITSSNAGSTAIVDWVIGR